MPRFHHQHAMNPAPLNQTITEEEEQQTTPAEYLHEGATCATDFLQFNNSRLPKPNNNNVGLMERAAAKKAGTSWLSRLRLNAKRS
jgi:hypothetical protein